MFRNLSSLSTLPENGLNTPPGNIRIYHRLYSGSLHAGSPSHVTANSHRQLQISVGQLCADGTRIILDGRILQIEPV